MFNVDGVILDLLLTMMNIREKSEMTDEANRIIKHIKQMEASLDDAKNSDTYAAEDDSLRVSYPLMKCLQNLKQKHASIGKLHKERYEQVRSESPS